MQKNRTIKPLPFYFYFWAAVVLTVIGFADSIYLAISHYRVYTDIGYKSFCAISKAINCDTVSQSPYAVMLHLPLAVWGIIGYGFVLLLLLFASSKSASKTRIWSLIFWTALLFSLYSVILALISTYFIGSYCIMCIVTYGVNLTLLYVAWIIRRRFASRRLFEDTRQDLIFLWQHKSGRIKILGAFCLLTLFTWIFFPAYWNFKPPPLAADIPSGINESGHPWIGALNPMLEITEFADYQCFQCKKMHFFLRQLIAQHPGKIRLIHKNYPMDHEFNPIVKEPFHVGAGKMALLAAYAAKQGKFWEMNDLLYSTDGNQEAISTKSLADQLDLDPKVLAGFMRDPATNYRLRHDIWTGNKLGITGTPAFLIDGEIYQGQIPPEILKKGLE